MLRLYIIYVSSYFIIFHHISSILYLDIYLYLSKFNYTRKTTASLGVFPLPTDSPSAKLREHRAGQPGVAIKSRNEAPGV